MTNKEIAQRLRELDETGNWGGVQDLADQLEPPLLEPPLPEPGTVVWWRRKNRPGALFRIGRIDHDGLGSLVCFAEQCNPYQRIKDIEYKPACILAPDEVAIHRKTAQAILGEYSYHNIGIGTVFATDARDDLREAILARAEAERMEAQR